LHYGLKLEDKYMFGAIEAGGTKMVLAAGSRLNLLSEELYE
jgi:hypothetical protein